MIINNDYKNTNIILKYYMVFNLLINDNLNKFRQTYNRQSNVGRNLFQQITFKTLTLNQLKCQYFN